LRIEGFARTEHLDSEFRGLSGLARNPKAREGTEGNPYCSRIVSSTETEASEFPNQIADGLAPTLGRFQGEETGGKNPKVRTASPHRRKIQESSLGGFPWLCVVLAAWFCMVFGPY
jgi:hypothetical protein